MRLYDRHLVPVSGVHGLMGLKYRVHEDEDSVDDSDYSLADEGEANAQRAARRRAKPSSHRRQRKERLGDDEGSVSSEDGSFFTQTSRASSLASGEVLIQQLSFESSSRKHKVALASSPHIHKKDDMLMSDDEEDEDVVMHGRAIVEFTALPVLGLDADQLDDDSSTMSSLVGEEHLFLGRTESNASLAGLGTVEHPATMKQSHERPTSASFDPTPHHPVHKSVHLKTLPPIPSLMSTDTMSSDEYGYTKKDIYPSNSHFNSHFPKPRDRLDSTASASSLVFNYSDGEASFVANGDAKSQHLLQKRRPVPINWIGQVDAEEKMVNHNVTNTLTSHKKSTFCENSASGSSLPDNDIPAIRSLASGSSRDSKMDPSAAVTHRPSSLEGLHPVQEQDMNNSHVDLLLDDMDWEAPVDHSFTTVDTPPFFTITIPKNWKQQEETKDALKKKNKHGKGKDHTMKQSHGWKIGKARATQESEDPMTPSLKNTLKNQDEIHGKNRRGRSTEVRVSRNNSMNQNLDHNNSRSESKTRFWSQSRDPVEKHPLAKPTVESQHRQNDAQQISSSKQRSFGDDCRSVSSNQTFWSTQSDGLLAQRRGKDALIASKGSEHVHNKARKPQSSSTDMVVLEDSGKDDKSVLSKNSFSSFRSFFSSRSWKKSKQRKSKARRARTDNVARSDDRGKTRWTWILRIFSGKKTRDIPNRNGKDYGKKSIPKSESMEEDMTNPTAELSELSFLSNSMTETVITDHGSVRFTGTTKYSHSNDLHVMEPSSRRSNDMGDVEKPPKPSRQNNGQTIIYPVEAHDTMVSVDHNMNSKGRVNHVSPPSTNTHYPHMINSNVKLQSQATEALVGSVAPSSKVRKDTRTSSRKTTNNRVSSEQLAQVTVSPHISGQTVSSNKSPNLAADRSSLKLINMRDGDRSAIESQSSSVSKDQHRVASTQTKMMGSYPSPPPKPPTSHHRCSSVGSARSVLSSSSRGSVQSNDSSTSRGSAQEKMSVNSMITTNSRTTNVSTLNSNAPKRIDDTVHKSHTRNVSISSTQSLNSAKSPVSPCSKRTAASSGSSVVSRGSYASNSSTISRNSAESSSIVSRKSGVSQSSASAQTWSSRGSWETVSIRDPCARPSKIVRKSSHLQQLTEKGDGDVWVEKLYKSKRTGEYKVYFVSINTGKRSRDEPPSGASKVIYRDYDVRFK